MAYQLKDQFGESAPRAIAQMIRAVHPEFPHDEFLRDALAGYGPLSLTGRGLHIAAALRKHLPRGLSTGGRRSCSRRRRQPHEHRASGGMAAFLYMPHMFFVAQHGLDHFEDSMRAQHALDPAVHRRIQHPRLPRETSRSARWRGCASGRADPSVHVRRLVSEGTRPRLPWAPRLRAFQKDPRPVLELLELLKDDPELYVRRSVANNLNDIGKDHPDAAQRRRKRWLRGATPERQWVIRHALRSAVKRADAGALTALGFGGKAEVSVREVRSRRRARRSAAA